MKILLYFFSYFSLPVLIGCQKSPEELCFDSQLEYLKSLYKPYGEWNDLADETRAQHRAEAWTACMKK